LKHGKNPRFEASRGFLGWRGVVEAKWLRISEKGRKIKVEGL
jgi:hypothetical protein